MPTRDLRAVATLASRCALGLVAVGVIVGVAASAAMVLQLWPPPSPGSAEGYTRALSIHGAVLPTVLGPAAAMAVVTPLVVPIERARMLLVPIGVGLVAWITAAAIIVASSWLRGPPELDPWPTIAAWSLATANAAFASAMLAAAIVELRARRAGVAAPLAIAAATVFAMTTAMLMDAANPVSPVIAAVGLAVLALTRLTPQRVASPALVFVALGVLPALVAERLLGRILAFTDLDVHLHDTYFDVARDHLSQFAAGAALLACVHVLEEPLFRRHARALLAWPGAVLTCAGFLAHHVVMILLGADSMPRRYAVYSDTFAKLQQFAQIAGAAVLVGFAMVVAAWIFGAARRDPPQDGGNLRHPTEQEHP